MSTSKPGERVSFWPREQRYGPEPTEVRETGHYQAEYVQSFVEKWDALIDWKARAASEGQFFIDTLREHGKRKVLDVACGTGFHSVQLLKAGFEVTSVDGNPQMIAKAFENAKAEGLILRTVHSDWRWLGRDVHDKYDAIICLGNSFTHLFSERDRRRALAEFYSVLRQDGILIIDQRNYDAILDAGFDSKHKFYYCGKDISAEPEFVDEGLARFKYEFADGAVFHLNMFPLRREYLKGLIKSAGFQALTTFGDFQETFQELDPDFLVHVVEKQYREDGSGPEDEVVETTERYYDSSDADRFYAAVWGGEDIHIGLYDRPDEAIAVASERSMERLAAWVSEHASGFDGKDVVDLGAGYGGAARRLALRGAHVRCVNLSEAQNQRNRELTAAAHLVGKVAVHHGNFESLPFEASSADIAWSQDAILHSARREKVLAEAFRVLRPGGLLVFTDPMQADDCPPDVLQPVLDRIHLASLGSFASYRRMAAKLGFAEVAVEDHTPHLRTHYAAVKAELERRVEELSAAVSPEYIARMLVGLQHWIDAADAGYLAWGFLLFRKPA